MTNGVSKYNMGESIELYNFNPSLTSLNCFQCTQMPAIFYQVQRLFTLCKLLGLFSWIGDIILRFQFPYSLEN